MPAGTGRWGICVGVPLPLRPCPARCTQWAAPRLARKFQHHSREHSPGNLASNCQNLDVSSPAARGRPQADCRQYTRVWYYAGNYRQLPRPPGHYPVISPGHLAESSSKYAVGDPPNSRHSAGPLWLLYRRFSRAAPLRQSYSNTCRCRRETSPQPAARRGCTGAK